MTKKDTAKSTNCDLMVQMCVFRTSAVGMCICFNFFLIKLRNQDFQNAKFEHFRMGCHLQKRVTIEEVMHEVKSPTLHLNAAFH